MLASFASFATFLSAQSLPPSCITPSFFVVSNPPTLYQCNGVTTGSPGIFVAYVPTYQATQAGQFLVSQGAGTSYIARALLAADVPQLAYLSLSGLPSLGTAAAQPISAFDGAGAAAIAVAGIPAASTSVLGLAKADGVTITSTGGVLTAVGGGGGVTPAAVTGVRCSSGSATTDLACQSSQLAAALSNPALDTTIGYGFGTTTPSCQTPDSSHVYTCAVAGVGLEVSAFGAAYQPAQTAASRLTLLSTLASAATITPSTYQFTLTGTTQVATITLLAGMSSTLGGCLKFATPMAVPFTTSGGNISYLGFTSPTAAGSMHEACWFGSSWVVN